MTLSLTRDRLKQVRRYSRILRGGIHEIVRQRYAGSLLGKLWALLYPSALLLIYATLYLLVFRIRVPNLTGPEYVILVFAGLVPLLAFSEMLQASVSSISIHRDLILNGRVPHIFIPTQAAVASQVPALFGFLVTLSAAALVGTLSIGPQLLLLPIIWALLGMFSLGIGYFLALASLAFQDIRHGLSLIILGLFVVSPFAYTREMVPPNLLFILRYNPLSYFVTAFQSIIVYGEAPNSATMASMLLFGGVSLAIGALFFQRTRKVFFDFV
jgi:lipopolysaccharide transport system permease protein